MSDNRPLINPKSAWIAVALAWIAGGVDAIGFLSLYHLFTAHMSGNTIAMGANIGHEWSVAIHRALPIPIFVLGIMIGAAISELAIRARMRHIFALLLGIESILLIVYLVLGSRFIFQGELKTGFVQFYTLVALASSSMGIQNAAFRRVGRMRIRTTYISGILTVMADAAIAYLFWIKDGRRVPSLAEGSGGRDYLHVVLMCGGIWLAYVGGAVVAGYAERLWNLKALLFPLGGLFSIIAVDLVRPLFDPEKLGTEPFSAIP